MQFSHDSHREAYGRLQTYLGELFDDIHHDEDNGHFYVRYGSTVLEISVDPYGPEDAVVHVMAYCVQGVEVDDRLLRGLLELNHGLPFGAFSLVGNDIFYAYSLFGRAVERSNVLGAVAAVAETSDKWDDKIVAKYGGQRALDRIRDTGGRERRRQSLSN